MYSNVRVVKYLHHFKSQEVDKSFIFLIVSIAVVLSCKLGNLILIDKFAEGLAEKKPANVCFSQSWADVENFIVLTIFHWSTIYMGISKINSFTYTLS